MQMPFPAIIRQLESFLWPEQDARPRRKRERILAAAAERFIAYGYRKTSIDDVARAAGIGKGTVYLYYRSKPELLFHAMGREKLAYLQAHLEPLWQRPLEADERLRELIAVGLVMNREMPLVARFTGGDHELALAMEEVDSGALAGLSDLQMQITITLLDAATGHGLPRRELEARARVLIDVISAVMTSRPMVTSDMPREEYARRMAQTLVSGITAPAQPAAAAVPRKAGAP